MKLTISIGLDNAGMQDDSERPSGLAIAGVLGDAAGRIWDALESEDHPWGILKDPNGNTVGNWKVQP